MARVLLLALGAACVFAAVAAIMLKIMPAPLKDSDYLVAGSVATLVALLALFLALIATSVKAGDTFFKKRRKQR